VTKSLGEQLEEFAEDAPLPNALAKLGILESGENFQSAHIIRDWMRGGAETYNLIFEVVSSQRTASYILKACAPFSPAVSIDHVLKEWIDRRTLLQQHGVKVPQLYGARLGMLLEDFIPYELSKLDTSKWTSQLVGQVFHLAKTLTDLRFAAVSPFADLRTNRISVFQIDFGTDLGEPYVKTPLPDYLALAQKWLQSLGVQS
jgi:hypothetical protein